MVKKMKKLEESFGLNLDDPTVEEIEIIQDMLEEREFAKSCEDYVEQEMRDKYKAFTKAVVNSGVDVERLYDSIPTNKKHLREIMGYNVLIGRKGKPVLLDNAKNSRIGKAYLKTYNTAKRALHP